MSILKFTIGIVGEHVDDMIDNFEKYMINWK